MSDDPDENHINPSKRWLLADTCDFLKINILGIQEARSAKGTKSNDLYWMLCSGYDQSSQCHNFGCELWIAKSFPVAGKVVAVTANHFSVILAHPRMLLVNITISTLAINVLVFHAPYQPSLVAAFYCELRTAIALASSAPLVFLCD